MGIKSGKTTAYVIFLIIFSLFIIYPVSAEVIDLTTVLGNSGFEDDLFHAQWTATKKNANYRLDAPQVNPVIIPKGATISLEVPAGNNFIGILNPNDEDINGRLVHDVVKGPFPKGTVFKLTIFGNKGRLSTAPVSIFPNPKDASELTVQFFGWKAGSKPTINPNTDNWSRSPSLVLRRVFSNWAQNGQWSLETFEFVANNNLEYISLAVTGKNHKLASYVAFDLGP
ncbi:hypothetical protein J4448_03440 [Candidatus Woesearchaeota archaeon]|nr:hypothetical protein [Candidatus Woesearchaeota archaeon]